MNLLGETVVDLYEEIMLLDRRREQEQYLIVEYTMRLGNAIAHGGEEFRWYRGAGVDAVDLAVVASSVWTSLSNRSARDYTDLENLQAKLRRDSARISMGIVRRTKRQAAAFRYWLKL